MGQAKNRGNQAQRIEEARARERAKLPASVKCEMCQADLTDIHPLPTRNHPGLWAAGRAECQPCGHSTWAFHGEPAVVREVAQAWREAFANGFPD